MSYTHVRRNGKGCVGVNPDIRALGNSCSSKWSNSSAANQQIIPPPLAKLELASSVQYTKTSKHFFNSIAKLEQFRDDKQLGLRQNVLFVKFRKRITFKSVIIYLETCSSKRCWMPNCTQKFSQFRVLSNFSRFEFPWKTESCQSTLKKPQRDRYWVYVYHKINK